MLHWIIVLTAAIPCFNMSWHLLCVWREPRSIDDGKWVRFGVGIVCLEFIIVHSGIVLAIALPQSEFRIVFLARLLQAVFVGVFSFVFRSWLFTRDLSWQVARTPWASPRQAAATGSKWTRAILDYNR